MYRIPQRVIPLYFIFQRGLCVFIISSKHATVILRKKSRHYVRDKFPRKLFANFKPHDKVKTYLYEYFGLTVFPDFKFSKFKFCGSLLRGVDVLFW